MGASLQHYNPLIDDEVRRVWNLSDDWKLIAQMPFGVPVAQPGFKAVSYTHLDVYKRQVLDCTVLTKTIGYDIRVGLIFF